MSDRVKYLAQTLLMPIAHLPFSAQSTRVLNALRGGGIIFVGDLVRLSEDELLKLPNFRWKSLAAVKQELAKLGLCLYMNLPEWDDVRPTVPVDKQHTGRGAVDADVEAALALIKRIKGKPHRERLT